MAEIRARQKPAIAGQLVCAFLRQFGPLLAVAALLGLASATGFAQGQPKHAQGASGNAKQASSPSSSTTKMTVSGKYLHLSCTRSLRDLTNNKLECFGNVYIRRPNELLTSDYAIMDLNTEQLHAEGNVVYFTPDTVIYGTKMDFNFVTETGVIYDGRVESDKYQLLGERIERRSLNHFLAYEGEYTTCRDCPASWRIMGHSVDLTVEGYAFLNRVYIKINEAPIVFLPYAIFPVKTKRQSGLLYPRFGLGGTNGFQFMQPFFWAISRSQDATVSLGAYSLRGVKGEGEYRYMLGRRSKGQLNSFYLRDKSFIRDPYYNRWALNYNHNLELPWKFDQKLTWLDASDRDYPSKIGDIPGRGEPALISEAGLTRPDRDVTFSATAKRIHNLLTPNIVGFDYNTVQLLPSISLTALDHQVSDSLPLQYGASFNFSRFWRIGPSFDPIYNPLLPSPPSGTFFIPGQTPLRRAQRFNLVPEVYYAWRPFHVFSLVPSVKYQTYGYLFDSGVAAPTARGYLQAQAELSTSFERVYGGVVKHKFTPSFTYSNIPIIQQNAQHPFIQQLQTAGYEFDENDIVPITSDTQLYFVPLGNSLSYEFSNKFILKKNDRYSKVLDITSGQSINFLEYKKDAGRQPLSRFYTLATLSTPRVNSSLEYYYYPYYRNGTYNFSLSYIFARYTRRLLTFDRSLTFFYSYDQILTNANTIGGTLNFSFNDYFALYGGVTYTMPTSQNMVTSPGILESINGGAVFQSPSQCYRILLLASRTVDNPQLAISLQVPLNLSGDGFTNFQDGGVAAAVPGQGSGSPAPTGTTALPGATGSTSSPAM